MQQALEAVFAALVLGPAPSRADLVASCAEHGVGADDAAALESSFERLLVYRELVRGNLYEAVQLSIPRSMARLGAVFDEYFARFLNERAPRTHYLRDVTTELLEFCLPLWQNDARIPTYLGELALHESLQIEVSALPALPRGHVAAPLSLDQGVELGAALRLVSYRHAVHELPEAETDRSPPVERQVSLLAYRSPEHDVRYLELTPLAHGIVQRLLSGDTLAQAVQGAAAAISAPLTEALLSGAARLLADLAERGVVWGPKIPGHHGRAPEPAARPSS
jgi:hypothetical protein